MPNCAAVGCRNYVKLGSPSGITFHRFPADSARREEWLRNLMRPDWSPSKYSRLCSLHFTDDCFDKSGERVLLKKASVPTIFNDFFNRVWTIYLIL